MINNYFFLTRFVKELRTELTGYRLINTFSQEKNKLLLSFSKNNEELFLEFHTGVQLPYLQMRDSFHRAKKNTSSFFEEYCNAELRTIQIAKFERIIKLTFDNFSIFLLFRGKDSNALLVSNIGGTEVFKDYTNETFNKIIAELNETDFVNTFSFPNELNPAPTIKEFKNRYPSFGKKLITEIFLRSENEHKSLNDIVTAILFEIDNKGLGLYLNLETKEYSLLPESFLTKNTLQQEKLFNNCREAVHEFLLVQMQFHLFQSLYKQAEKFLEKEFNYASAKLEAIKKKMDEGSKENIYTEYANLLLISLPNISKGMNEFEVENIYHDGIVEKIILKENLSPNENVNYYFSKAKSEKIFFIRAKTEILQLSKRLEIAAEQRKQLSAISSLSELKQFTKVFPLKNDVQKNDGPKINFKQFLIDGMYKVYVGKDSKNNDLLTTKFARQNDLWFHARSVSGSHVVLRVENTKEAVPKPVLKKVAQLAAFYSKAKTAGTAPVSYALKKFVVKRKGMEVGMVSMLREDTLLVKPEIPQGCEMIFEEKEV
ncbi:MAG: NFACT RNA binding domain-containing protein [Ignavibacteriaceae bacterium]|nr:NFACT RNA binding domain-containing protein [Ignavibacteriaceae bacterium]